MKKGRNRASQSLINSLILQSSLTNNPGLLNGKMGISIFFFHLARKTGNSVYEDHAGELLEQVLKQIHGNSSVDFSSGLAGIGWGVEYLLYNGYIESNEDKILEELDSAIFQLDARCPSLQRFYDDYYGYGLYYLFRTKNNIWSEKVLQLIWSDIKALLTETLPADIKLCPKYVISVLYFILEMQKRPFCPSDVAEMIVAVPAFISKYMSGRLNAFERLYLTIVLKTLNIPSFCCPQIEVCQLPSVNFLELYGQMAVYSIVFKNIQHPSDSVLNYKVDKFCIRERKEMLEKIKKNHLSITEMWEKCPNV